MRHNRQHILVLETFSLVLWLTSRAMLGGCCSDSVLASVTMPDRIEEILHWLPPDTETIVVSNSPFKLEKTSDDQSFRFQKAVESLPITILLHRELMPKELIGQKVSLAVEGSRCFRSPHGLGMMPFQGCQVIVFEKDAVPALTAAMRSLLIKAQRTIELSGRKVAVFEEKWEEDKWTIQITQPRPGILLCATHEGYLKDVLSRMEGKRSTIRAIPQDSPEWKYVNTNSRVWAVRHYSKAEATRDPSSPLRDEAAANVPDLGALGLAFSYNPDGKSATVYYLTRSEGCCSHRQEMLESDVGGAEAED